MTHAKTRASNSGNRPWVELFNGLFGSWAVVVAAAGALLYLGDCLETPVQKDKRIDDKLAPWIREIESLKAWHETHQTNGPLIDHRLGKLEQAVDELSRP